jgi:2-polyprenyl-3-methyl-5-hydroxy-6-metoxy-1,4-benzoquinol methylase
MLHRNVPLCSFKTHKGVPVHQMMRENAQFFMVGETDRHKVKMFEIKDEALIRTYLEESGATSFLDTLDNEAELVKLRTGLPLGDLGHLEDLTEEEFTPEEEDENEDPEEVILAEEAPEIRNQKYNRPYDMQEEDDVIYDHVPMQGKARNSVHFDRRKRQDTKQQEASAAQFTETEKEPVAPKQLATDACVGAAVSLYNSWAVDGRDVVMEVSNEPPLISTLQQAVASLAEEKPNLRVVDVGCGNGWATRRTKVLAPGAAVTAMDAASLMVKRAKELDPEAQSDYIIGDVASWAPAAGEKVDLVLAVELMHLMENPKAVLERVTNWLAPGGKLIMTLECYKENRLSSSWSADLGVPMTLLAEKKWSSMVENAGLQSVTAKRSMPSGPWPGMLIIEGTKA